MPNGAPPAPVPAPAPVHNDFEYRAWAAAKLIIIENTLSQLPCQTHAERIDSLRLNGATAAGQRALIIKVLPWILAALGLGTGLGVSGKTALDTVAPKPAPIAASAEAPTPPSSTAR